MGKRWRRMRGRWLAASILALLGVGAAAFAAYGASPEFARTQEEWSRLRDNVIEYGELTDLVHEFNATVQNNQYEYRKFREDYGETNREVSEAYYDLAQDFYNDMSGESEAGSMIADLQLEIQAGNMLKQADETLEDSRIYFLNFEMAECQLTAAAQSDMISFHRKKLEMEQLRLNLDIARWNQEQEQLRYGVGMSTGYNLLDVQQAVLQAEQDIAELETDLSNLRETLVVSLGWKHDDMPEIGEIPEVDMERLERVNPDNQLDEAIENNYTLKINMRRLENSSDQTVRESLESKISNNKTMIGAGISNAYKGLKSARLTYDKAAAEESLQSETLRLAAVKRRAGQITEAEYYKQEYGVRQAEIQRKMSSMTLFQALETYDWMVNGLAVAE